MPMLMFWVFTEKNHLSPDHMFQDTRKPKSWIILQNNGTWSKIIHLLLETGKFLIHNYQINFKLQRISHYATTSTQNSVYVMGGYTHDSSTNRKTSIIAKYTNDDWFAVGNLRQSRHGHSGITFGSMTMIIGGISTDGKP